ncbi:hypothetical protein RHMOL_Rhmol01G0168400 [Rhododendron molle]|uniref:Uncharacterized protein n=1 Tax=Rhododendron molle TaxID=49168 RepID=A0ACC0Q5A0_RHOML|nr:hypothetical protein RHMOL_Rhmol01G0168400 [Rhododendron molle]
MAPPKKKTKGNVVAVDCRNEELKEMDEEYRNEVPKHLRNAWIFFYQEQCKLKDDNSLKTMNTFISRTQLKAAYDRMQELDPLQLESVKAMGFGVDAMRDGSCGSVKVIIEDEVGKRERMMNQGREVDHDKSMENDQVKNLTSMVERMSSLLEETLVAMHEKDRKRKYSATNGGINKKDTPSDLEEPDVEGHFKTKKAKCTENALLDQMTSPLKTNKEKGQEEAKLNVSSK